VKDIALEPLPGMDSPEHEEFVSLAAGPFRKELLAHSYRMLGSLQDAEDLVQDAFLRAWRAFDQFDPVRGTMRAWLYRIATNACLTRLHERGPRSLPSELVPQAENPADYPSTKYPEITWVEPFPDVLLGSASDDPAAIVTSRASIRLAFIAALQHLPPRQRATLILRDVLAWRSAEVADLLETTPTAINSALQRARTQLSQVSLMEDEVAEPSDAEQLTVLNRYVTAFEASDVPALTALLREDALMEMPPWLHWMRGRDRVGAFLEVIYGRRPPGAWRVLTTFANRQPAMASYLRGEDGLYHPHNIQLFTIAREGIAHMVAFVDTLLFAAFSLPDRLV
jgi:RNA polymerase sigma-70 factor, ECF subfamily